jgi:hypothetical protein
VNHDGTVPTASMTFCHSHPTISTCPEHAV